ncbi:hypothetical protein N2152v2_005480 [Parachlorella kessleri]|uniref:Adenylyltransferase and sulfurtransferase MOCS3 n=1 Tax=Parachlorella kessleri TaxID=3074 RepID=A0A146HU42_PARKE|nr:adenylyltransferase and sulfurtransferase [Parachlorella kessleri]
MALLSQGVKWPVLLNEEPSQARLCRGSVLIVGAGGLGSPAALYLAAAGVGRIGVVDKDEVELSNLHRQIIHREANVGQHKALSAAAACSELNSSIQLETHCNGFSPANAVELVQRYDVVVDASDNAPTRYLISDACAAAKRPLVSGAAIGMDGQLTVYCHGDDGPCYRCLFPAAPRPESCSRCSDAGVLGAVPGVIGTLQAVEAIKILSGIGDPLSRRLLLVDTLSARFHTVKLRARSPDCIACGKSPSITAASLPSYDYAAFTGQQLNDSAPAPLQLIPEQERITPSMLQQRLENTSRPCVLLDVRPPEQYNICHLPGALHVPFTKFDAHIDVIKAALQQASAAGRVTTAADGAGRGTIAGGDTQNKAPSAAAAAAAAAAPAGELGGFAAAGVSSDGGRALGDAQSEPNEGAQGQPAAGEQQQQGAAPVDLYVLCRRGNDSQRAVARLRQLGIVHGVDVVGGMEAWAQQVDPDFPTY